MDICKASTLRLKALNNHSITHNEYRDENAISEKRKKEKKLT